MKHLTSIVVASYLAITLTATAQTFTPDKRGPNFTRWSCVQAITNGTAKVLYRTNSFMELGAGLNRGSRGAWEAANPTIAPGAAGGTGTNARHTVQFAADLNTTGAIALTGPDGMRIRSHVLGLGYYDAASGQSVLIAQVKDSVGQIQTSKDRVIYTNAFQGINADVRYAYTRGGLEQDVILRAQIPAPESYGMDTRTTKLQVLSEFLNQPTHVDTSGLDDQIVFGAMKFAQGRAFSLGKARSNHTVHKQWVQMDGRQLLIESVSAAAIRREIASLPASQASLLNKKATPTPDFPLAPSTSAPTGSILMAQAADTRPGFVLDWYITLGTDSVDSYTFQAGTLYLISDTFMIGDATFEGGTVIKFGANGMLSVGNFTSKTTQFEPVIFTSQQDNNVSWNVSSGTAPGTSPYLSLLSTPGTVTLANMQFKYAPIAVALAGGNLDVWDCQFVDCPVAVLGQNDVTNVSLHNVLFSRCAAPVQMSGTTTSALSGEQITADSFGTFAISLNYPLAQCQLRNSIFTQGGDLYDYTDGEGNGGTPPPIESVQVVQRPQATGTFTSVGAGNYYLADTTLRGAGDSGITPQMAAELQQKTTFPPLVLSNTYPDSIPSLQPKFTQPAGTVPLIDMAPTVARNTEQPDLGYHYPPADFLVDVFKVTNCTLQVSSGTVIAYAHTSAGILLGDGVEIICVGDPVNRNVFVSYCAIQEQPINCGEDSNGPAYSLPINPCRYNTHLFSPGTFRFTDILALPGNSQLLYINNAWGYDPLIVRDCRLVNGSICWWPDPDTCSFDMENTACEYALFDIQQWSDSSVLHMLNNTIRGTYYFLISAGSSIRDNIFDNSDVDVLLIGDLDMSNNAFISSRFDDGAPSFLPGPTDQAVASFPYYEGPFGSYYHFNSDDPACISLYTPTLQSGISQTLLMGLGSRTFADAGLTFNGNPLYTVKLVDQAGYAGPDETATTPVAFGVQYIAPYRSWIGQTTPADYNQNGIWDYLEVSSANDGIPDYWKLFYGLNPYANAASLNLNNNGLTCLQDYMQGRNPRTGSVPDMGNVLSLTTFTPSN